MASLVSPLCVLLWIPRLLEKALLCPGVSFPCHRLPHLLTGLILNLKVSPPWPPALMLSPNILSLLGMKNTWKSSVYVCFTPQKVSLWEQGPCLFSLLLDTRTQSCVCLWNKRINNGPFLLPFCFLSYHHKGLQEIYHPSKTIFFGWLIHEIISPHMYSCTDLITYGEYILSPYYV